jgi:hypothetical protein
MKAPILLNYPKMNILVEVRTEELLHESLKIYEAHKDNPCVITPSLPILYFGNLPEYRNSNFKVITAALNPSDMEFKELQASEPSFVRFPKFESSVGSLYEALNGYFENRPYKRWFGTSSKTKSGFLPLLEGMGASYYAGFANRALHTDLCSPLATKPTWSGLKSTEQAPLFYDGFNLWKSLLIGVKPDLILISLKKEYLDLLPLNFVQTLYVKHGKESTGRKQMKYTIEHYKIRLGDFETNLVWGSAQNTPLQPFSDKFRLGQELFERLKPYIN